MSVLTSLNLKTTCRACLLEFDELNSLFGGGTDQVSLAILLMACCELKIEVSDGLPHQLCIECTNHLVNAYNFKVKCEQSDKLLLDYISKERLKSESKETNRLEYPITEINIKTETIDEITVQNEPLKETETSYILKNERSESFDNYFSDDDHCIQNDEQDNNENTPELSSTSNIDNLLSCELCDITFKSKKTLAHHLKTKHTGKNLKRCNICKTECSKRCLELEVEVDIEGLLEQLSDIEDDSNQGNFYVNDDIEFCELIPNKIRIGADIVSYVDEERYLREIVPLEETSENPIRTSNLNLTEMKNVKWYRRSFPFTDGDKAIFNQQPSLLCPDVKFPIDYFKKYLSENFFEKIVENTNMYALQISSSMKPTNLTEMKNLIAIHIYMGTLKYSRTRLYWNTNLKIDIISKSMGRKRFYELRQHLQLIKNDEIPKDNKDALVKVRPIFDKIRDRCLQLQLGTHLCVDDQIVPFKGRLAIKQYAKDKSNPWGIKIFLLCGESGLIHDFLIYQGNTTEIEPDILQSYGLGAGAVLHLSRNIPSSSHSLTFDHFFTSYNLLENLKERKILGMGTAKIDRFNKPPFSNEKEMRAKGRGYFEEVVSNDEKIVLTKWYDNKEILLASNFVGIGQKDSVERWNKDVKKYVKVDRPEIVKLYNQTMGGVDKLNQFMSYYRINIKSKKWTLRMIFHAVDMAVTNSWIEYRQDCEKAVVGRTEVLDLMDFRIRVADALFVLNRDSSTSAVKREMPSTSEGSDDNNTKRKKFEIRPAPEIAKDSYGHFPEYDANKEASRCKAAGCKGKTHIYCMKCRVHLCFVKNRSCFFSFHKKD